MLLDVVALHEARTGMTAAREALPDAPVVPEAVPAPPRPSRVATLRLRTCLLLRGLADRIEPAPAHPAGTAAPTR